MGLIPKIFYKLFGKNESKSIPEEKPLTILPESSAPLPPIELFRLPTVFVAGFPNGAQRPPQDVVVCAMSLLKESMDAANRALEVNPELDTVALSRSAAGWSAIYSKDRGGDLELYMLPRSYTANSYIFFRSRTPN